MHLDHAEEHIARRTWWSRLLHGIVWTTTDNLIWLSTWGDSTAMARDLAAARRAQ
jgi:hypothetical protein